MFDNPAMLVQKNVPLQPFNSFHIVAKAQALVCIRSESDVLALLADPEWAASPRLVLGGGSNIVLTGDVKALVLKVALSDRLQVVAEYEPREPVASAKKDRLFERPVFLLSSPRSGSTWST